MESRGEPVKKSGLKNIFYYKHEMMAALLALGGILGLVGSYQYYSQIFLSSLFAPLERQQAE